MENRLFIAFVLFASVGISIGRRRSRPPPSQPPPSQPSWPCTKYLNCPKYPCCKGKCMDNVCVDPRTQPGCHLRYCREDNQCCTGMKCVPWRSISKRCLFTDDVVEAGRSELLSVMVFEW